MYYILVRNTPVSAVLGSFQRGVAPTALVELKHLSQITSSCALNVTFE